MLSITPPVEELVPSHKIRCAQLNCGAVFTNAGNYELHMLKKHNVTLVKPNQSNLFYCPEANCAYNVKNNSKHFKNLKYLRQHYQKVHMSKVYICPDCEKGFSTASRLKAHTQKECGILFVCSDCGTTYATNEALLTHIKRKGHSANKVSKLATTKTKFQNKVLNAKNKGKNNNKMSTKEQETQTEDTQTTKASQIGSSQTETFCINSEASISNDLNIIQSILRDIETQTDASEKSDMDKMLAQSSHTHTQTCEDIFLDICMADMKKQPNWLALPMNNDKNPYVSTATSPTAYIPDELFVSTETQTSFTQCLMDSRANGAENTFGSLCNTQYTQTCDTLLDGLFGVQDNDLIANFTSAYTQT
ncbi:transcription factor E4F1 [Teleopsis dalmanni]|uniref:transcription factor E4F1 n=1 Tax=Teleopsis dalmanni TaxID=139649 RepID=UPI0018CC8567|nr:transcription factor E4F1 [Teleopsis dalmanni]